MANVQGQKREEILSGKGVPCGTESLCVSGSLGAGWLRVRLRAGKGEDEMRAVLMSTSMSWFIAAVSDLTPLCLTPSCG